MRLRGALLVLCLLATGAGAAAEPVAFSSPRPGESFRAGDEVEIRWTGVPSGAEEMELLLSLDGGRRVALRLTSEIAAAERSFLWTIPNLGSSEASLVLRVGAEGRETIVGASPAFTIVADPSLGFETLALHSGELWLARESAPSDPLPLAAMSSRESGWTVSEPAATAAALSSSNLLPPPSAAHLPRERSRETPRRAFRRAASDSIPLLSPALRL